MSTANRLALLSLAFSVLALAVSGYGATRNADVPAAESAAPRRPTVDGARIDRIARTVEELRESIAAPRETEIDDRPETEGLGALVDEAVEKKARSIAERARVRQDRKPTLAVFARELGLTDDERASVGAEVIRGQREVFDILEVVTDDGRNLLDELVDLYASALAKPGEDPGWGKWYGAVLTERIPGDGNTYAARIEVVKTSMRETFRAVLGEKRFAEFMAWGVDPVDIRAIPDSPGDALGMRIRERARGMGGHDRTGSED
jgi:hypothetical protein